MGQILDIQADTFKLEVLEADKPVVLEFWVRSCGVCRKFKPVFEQLPSLFGGQVKFTRMNMFKSIENLRLAEGMGVEATPTLKFFCKGEEVGGFVGYKSLDEAVEEIKDIFSKAGCT